MSTITAFSDPFPTTWRLLGLNVAAGFVGLGAYAMLFPTHGATHFGLIPQNSPGAVPTNALTWIGARDISIGAALFAFYYQGKPSSMGTLILASMILCTVDTVLVYRHRGDLMAVGIGVGASIWGWIGWNLHQLQE